MGEATVIPSLRNGLQIFPFERTPEGRASFQIYDPLREAYYHVTEDHMRLLSVWGEKTHDGMCEAYCHKYGAIITKSDIDDFLKNFLIPNALVRRDGEDVRESYIRIRDSSHKDNWLKSLSHSYLFFRIPLWNPNAFVKETLWIGDIFASKGFFFLSLVVLLIGLYLTGKQWDIFLATFSGFTNINALITLGVVLASVKIFHEFGHAYALARRGGDVPSMGVAFMLLYPVLYTDTTHAWRIQSRSDRVAIALAGVKVELYIAAYALLLWNVFPSGLLGNVFFILATATWVTTLVINLNPLMRFDGYYLASDLLRTPNLQPRSFALAKWHLREFLFSYGDACPEIMDRKRMAMLIAYAWATWIYRFFLFLGIALIVYHMFFKALGIILFVIEILYFIILPIFREITMWVKLRNRTKLNTRSVGLISVFVFAVSLVFMPLSRQTTIPVEIGPSAYQEISAPEVSRLLEVLKQNGDLVEKGEIIARFESPEISRQILMLDQEIIANVESLRRAGQIGSGSTAFIRYLQENQESLQQRREALKHSADNLTVRATMSGRLSDVATSAIGAVVQQGFVVGRILSADVSAFGYVDHSIINRIAIEAGHVLVQDQRNSFGGWSEFRLVSIGSVPVETLQGSGFLSHNGGHIVAERVGQQYRPRVPLYEVQLTPETLSSGNYDAASRWMTTATISLTPKSPASIMADRIAAILYREVSR